MRTFPTPRATAAAAVATLAAFAVIAMSKGMAQHCRECQAGCMDRCRPGCGPCTRPASHTRDEIGGQAGYGGVTGRFLTPRGVEAG